MKIVYRAAAVAVLLATSASTHAGQRFCVFDFLGTSGDAFGMARDYVLAMQHYKVDIELKAYTSEAVATDDFRTGNCDALLATAFRTRQFNPVAASTDSLGATTIVRNGAIDMPGTYEVMRKLIQTYATPSPLVTKLMVNGDYEVGGILPIGPAYPFVNDRRMTTVEALAGKRIAAFDYDKAQAVMIQRIGAQPVSADVTNLHTKFNNGLVDMIAVPTLAYKPLELQKGLGTKGGVSRFPIMIVTYQMIFNRTKFSEEFGQLSRSYWLSQFDRAMQLIRVGDSSIPPGAWLDVTAEDAYKYTLMLREARIQLAQQGIYDKRGLKVIKRIRCHVNASDPECATKSEEEWK